MAGAILIGEKSGVSMGSQFFIPIVERTREEFHPEEAEYMERIYQPYDHEGMSFIVLDDLPKVAFIAFCRAAEAAFEKHRKQSGSQCPEFALAELFEKLKLDPRYET